MCAARAAFALHLRREQCVTHATIQLKQFLGDDDAVSPVIGVILMVAITVILAAVIATFVLGLGDTQNTTPTASFSSDSDDDDGVVTFTHDGGDTIRQDELYVRGSGFDGGGEMGGSTGTWQGSASGQIEGESGVVAGDSVDVGVTSDYDLRVVYESNEGDSSAKLYQDSGPDA